jgi:hypothetical protein
VLVNGVPFASMTDWVESRRRGFMQKGGEAPKPKTADDALMREARKVKGPGVFFVSAFIAGA